MNRFPRCCAIAALLAGSLAAQQINIIIPSGAWSVAPASSQTYTPFSVSNGSSVVFGGLVTQIGTTASNTPTFNGYTLANATFQGSISGGPSVTGGLPTQTDSGTETYTRGVGVSTVVCDLNAYADPVSFVYRQGSGYRGVANASVAVSCPSYSLSASCQARGVAPPAFPLIMTVPQSGTTTVNGINSWWIAMSASADTNGNMTGPNAVLQLHAVCVADGNVTLY